MIEQRVKREEKVVLESVKVIEELSVYSSICTTDPPLDTNKNYSSLHEYTRMSGKRR